MGQKHLSPLRSQEGIRARLEPRLKALVHLEESMIRWGARWRAFILEAKVNAMCCYDWLLGRGEITQFVR